MMIVLELIIEYTTIPSCSFNYLVHNISIQYIMQDESLNIELLYKVSTVTIKFDFKNT